MQKTKQHFYIPDPFEIAILLTLVVFLLAAAFTDSGFFENLTFWGEGLWSLLSFMTQMSLILLGGFVLAVSRPVHLGLKRLVRLPGTSNQIYLMTFCVASFCCWLNWGLGLVVSAFFTLEVARQHKEVHFPLLVAISYMGFVFWHAGLSGSIPLVVSTPGSFSEQWVDEVIPLGRTLFSWFNISLILTLFGVLCFLILALVNKKKEGAATHAAKPDTPTFILDEPTKAPSRFLYWALVGLLLSYTLNAFFSGRLAFGLNQVNMLLITLGLIFHRNFYTYMAAVREGCRKIAPILVQYPLYAGILGVMVESGLADQISTGFVQVSDATTYPLYMFLSAGVVNFFVPSGGGQWAVQAPIVIKGAQQLGVPIERVVMAVAWGDAWTNLAQPFWALPLLSIAGVSLKDILGYCLLALVISGLVIGGFFLMF